MKATTKRLVGILLCLAMVLAMLPMAVSAETPTTLYVQPNSNWKADNARFAAVLATEGWSAQVWVDAADSDGDGIYEVAIPDDGNAYSIVIFCRMNPNAAANDWGNKWNQTSDLTIPTDGTNCYVVPEGTWDYGAGQWITLGGEVEPVTNEYYVVGSMNSWTKGDSNKMTDNGDGTWSVTMALAAGPYTYKITDTIGAYYPDGMGNDLTLNLTSDCDVTFTFTVATGETVATGDGIGEPEPVVYDYYVAGSEGLCGVEWDPAAADNKMTLNEETGLYEITFSVWVAGTYDYKVTTGSWDTPSYGVDGSNCSVTVYVPGEVTITFNAETTEVTCDVYQFGEGDMKFQFAADASADDDFVDLRLITYVDSLEYSSVVFYAVVDGVTSEPMECTTVYSSVKANGASLTTEDVFGNAGYMATFTMEEIPASYYGKMMTIYAEFTELDGSSFGTNQRTIVISDVL